MKRKILIIIGFIFIALGLIGTFIPVTTGVPFYIVAAVIFARTSNRCYRWLLYNRLFGNRIRAILDQRRVPLAASIIFLVFVWSGTAVSALFFIDSVTAKIAIVACGILLSILYLTSLWLLKKVKFVV